MIAHQSTGTNCAGGVGGEAGRRLHPRIGGDDPGGRDQRADRDHRDGEHVQPVADALAAEQRDAEEAGLEEEGGQHLVAHQRADHRAGLVGEAGPVGAELVAHHDARDDAHAEDDGEHRLPVVEELQVRRVALPQPQRVEHREVAREPDREGREDEVERDRERELDAGQQLRGLAKGHGAASDRAARALAPAIR